MVPLVCGRSWVTPIDPEVLSARGPVKAVPSKVLVVEAACARERLTLALRTGSNPALAMFRLSLATSVEKPWISRSKFFFRARPMHSSRESSAAGEDGFLRVGGCKGDEAEAGEEGAEGDGVAWRFGLIEGRAPRTGGENTGGGGKVAVFELAAGRALKDRESGVSGARDGKCGGKFR
jgi:hypothetical protein